MVGEVDGLGEARWVRSVVGHGGDQLHPRCTRC
jgi:hypothetical protein